MHVQWKSPGQACLTGALITLFFDAETFVRTLCDAVLCHRRGSDPLASTGTAVSLTAAQKSEPRP